MNSQEKKIIKQEKEQIKACLEAIRIDNDAIANRLSSMTAIVESTGKSQLRIEAIIIELEAKLNKK